MNSGSNAILFTPYQTQYAKFPVLLIYFLAEFTLPKEEARRLITSYNQVYELKIPNEIIELGLTRCTLKGDVIIDDLLKVLAKVYNSSF